MAMAFCRLPALSMLANAPAGFALPLEKGRLLLAILDARLGSANYHDVAHADDGSWRFHDCEDCRWRLRAGDGF